MRLVVLPTVIVAAALALAGPAAGHGPCRCLMPAAGSPGTVVAFEGPAFKIVFNPSRRDVPLGPPDLWRAHRDGVARTVVLRRSYTYSRRPPRVRVRWGVPDVPPGRYAVVIYDGTEGGAHYTWDFLEVTAAAVRNDRAADVPDAADGDGVGKATVGVVGGLSLAIGAGIGVIVGRRRPRRD